MINMLIDKLHSAQVLKKKPRIMVIGDLMIDHYMFGDASRLSPEAPVPVVNVKKDTLTLGGAGNVVKNLTALGVDVFVAGVAGTDEYGPQLLNMLKADGACVDGVLLDASRTTTIKTRVLAGSYQMLRIDREATNALEPTLALKLLAAVEADMQNADIVILSDYNKGIFSPQLTRTIINMANGLGKKVIVDPKGNNYHKYKGAFIVKPNRKELAQAAGTGTVATNEDLRHTAALVLAQTEADYLVVTLAEDGMAVITEREFELLPVKARNVFDVTGAGDTTLSAMAYCLSLGFSVIEACEVANHAAALVIQQIGSVATNVNEIINYMESLEYGSSRVA